MAVGTDREPGKKLRRVARALIAGDATPDHDEIAAFGLRLESEEPQHTECWPDNWQALEVFAALMTQWHVGMSGVIGLRYEAVQPVLDLMGVRKKARAGIFGDLRIMENEALQVFRDGK